MKVTDCCFLTLSLIYYVMNIAWGMQKDDSFKNDSQLVIQQIRDLFQEQISYLFEKQNFTEVVSFYKEQQPDIKKAIQHYFITEKLVDKLITESDKYTNNFHLITIKELFSQEGSFDVHVKTYSLRLYGAITHIQKRIEQ